MNSKKNDAGRRSLSSDSKKPSQASGIDPKYVRPKVSEIDPKDVRHKISGTDPNGIRPKVSGIDTKDIRPKVSEIDPKDVRHKISGTYPNGIRPKVAGVDPKDIRSNKSSIIEQDKRARDSKSAEKSTNSVEEDKNKKTPITTRKANKSDLPPDHVKEKAKDTHHKDVELKAETSGESLGGSHRYPKRRFTLLINENFDNRVDVENGKEWIEKQKPLRKEDTDEKSEHTETEKDVRKSIETKKLNLLTTEKIEKSQDSGKVKGDEEKNRIKKQESEKTPHSVNAKDDRTKRRQSLLINDFSDVSVESSKENLVKKRRKWKSKRERDKDKKDKMEILEKESIKEKEKKDETPKMEKNARKDSAIQPRDKDISIDPVPKVTLPEDVLTPSGCDTDISIESSDSMIEQLKQ